MEGHLLMSRKELTRKTILELSRQLNGNAPEFDPLAEMLKR
jgi:hypothetical protein